MNKMSSITFPDGSTYEVADAVSRANVKRIEKLVENLNADNVDIKSGVTAEQATTLLTILQKVGFTSVLTEEEINDFKRAWNLLDDLEEGEIVLGSIASATIVSWLSGSSLSRVGINYSSEVDVVAGEVSLKDPVRTEYLYPTTMSEYSNNPYNTVLGKYVKVGGTIYYIEPDSTYEHKKNTSGMVAENIIYNKTRSVSVE